MRTWTERAKWAALAAGVLAGTWAVLVMGLNRLGEDPNCVALWRMESGALPTDSVGSNTLTNAGVAEETTIIKEGGCSAYYNSAADRLYISDGALDAGFPLKNGDTNKKISICFWVQISSFSGLYSPFYVKGYTSARSFMVHARTGASDKGFYLSTGISGTDWEDHRLTCDVYTGRWYHVGATYDDSDKSYRLRVWDDTAASILELTGTGTNAILVTTGTVYIGYMNLYAQVRYFYGYLDEVVIFNDILTADEIDEIRGGTRPPGFLITVHEDDE